MLPVPTNLEFEWSLDRRHERRSGSGNASTDGEWSIAAEKLLEPKSQRDKPPTCVPLAVAVTLLAIEVEVGEVDAGHFRHAQATVDEQPDYRPSGVCEHYRRCARSSPLMSSRTAMLRAHNINLSCFP